MSNDKRTRAEQLSAILRDLDSLSAEARQLGEPHREDKPKANRNAICDCTLF